MSQVSVKILQQDYVLSCPDGQEAALLEAVVKANQAMQPLCELAKVRTREQAAVLAAVNFAFQNQALQKHIQQQLLQPQPAPICTAPTAAEQARLAEEQSMVVGERDLAKMTSAQLATLVEGEDLDIEPQGPQEKVPDYRVRVRDALKAKLAEQGE